MKKIIGGLVLTFTFIAHAQVQPVTTQPLVSASAASYAQIDALATAVDAINLARDKKVLTNKQINELCEKVYTFGDSLKSKSSTVVSSNAYYAQALSEHLHKLNKVNVDFQRGEMIRYYGPNYRKEVSGEIDVLKLELKEAKSKAKDAYPAMAGYQPLSDKQRKTLAVFYDLHSGCKAHNKKWGEVTSVGAAGDARRVSPLNPVVKTTGWLEVMDKALGVSQGRSGVQPPSNSTSGSN